MDDVENVVRGCISEAFFKVQEIFPLHLEKEKVSEWMSKIKGIDSNTVIYGKGGIFTSIMIVHLVAQIEAALSNHKVKVRLLTDKAFGKFHNPFHNIDTLTKFVKSAVEAQSVQGILDNRNVEGDRQGTL